MDFINVLAALENLTSNNQKQISKEDYDLFCQEFIFDKLKGQSFAEAFCERFNFNATFLRSLSDTTAKDHIETLGYIKK